MDWATLRLRWEPRMLSILRIVVGLLFLEHGTQKIFNFPPRPNATVFQLFTLVPGLAGVLELVGGILITIGLFTRPVAFILSGEMAFAYFIVARAARVLPDKHGRQRRRIGDRLLLHFSLFFLCRRRRLEPRSPAGIASWRKEAKAAVSPSIPFEHHVRRRP